MNAETINLAIFAALSLAALSAAGIAVFSASVARQAVALAGLAAALGAILAGFLGAGFAAAAILMAEVSISGVVLVTAARWAGRDRCEPPVGRLPVAVSTVAVALATAALLAALNSLEVLAGGSAEVAAAAGGAAGSVGRNLSGPRLLPFLLISFLLLVAVGGVVSAARHGTPVGGGEGHPEEGIEP